ncbi:hypothetical protein HHI36_019402 [Cryptolaemus montrouzieri]|uniref:Uncharacterized protein n=1 Tax=Cryptolaemus montrouzieri TaxID=559131 RepID=A0ABD2P2Z6_9CUCU
MSPPVQIPIPPLPEDVLKLPTQSDESTECAKSKIVEKIIKTSEVNETIETVAKQSIMEMHQDRMFFLREQLKLLKDTEWRYQPIDKLIGSCASSEAP